MFDRLAGAWKCEPEFLCYPHSPPARPLAALNSPALYLQQNHQTSINFIATIDRPLLFSDLRAPFLLAQLRETVCQESATALDQNCTALHWRTRLDRNPSPRFRNWSALPSTDNKHASHRETSEVSRMHRHGRRKAVVSAMCLVDRYQSRGSRAEGNCLTNGHCM